MIGRVRVFEQGRERRPWHLEGIELVLPDPDLRLSLFQVESGRERPVVGIDGDGWFGWILPAGTYLVFHALSVDPPFNEPLAAFQLAAGPDPVDLGELRLDLSVDRPGPGATASCQVLDATAQAGESAAVEARLAQHPGAGTCRRGSLVVDAGLRGLFSNWSRQACARLLAQHGIELGATIRPAADP